MCFVIALLVKNLNSRFKLCLKAARPQSGVLHLSQHQDKHALAICDFAAVKLTLTTSTVFWYLAGFMVL